MRAWATLLLLLLADGGHAFAPTLSHRRTFDTRLSVASSTAIRSPSLTMKLSKQGGRSGQGGSILSQKNQERVSKAGRRGTKKFVDPGKVFIGGIPFDAEEKDVMEFFRVNLGHTRNIVSLKIIRDWKTGDSKGFGFCIFTDPMFATCAMEFCTNKKMKGRIITLNQGQKKLDPNTLYIKKKKKPPVDQEEAAIQSGMDNAEGDIDAVTLEKEDSQQRPLEDFEDSDDAIMFADDDEDDDDFEFDGTFEEMYPVLYEDLTEEEKEMNREKRREAQKRKPRRRLPAVGFMTNTKAPAVEGRRGRVKRITTISFLYYAIGFLWFYVLY